MRSRETAPVTAKETATAAAARRRREAGGGEVARAEREREIREDFLGRVPFIQIHLLVPGGYTTRD